MPGPGGRDFQQSYNCQAVVDNANQVIVAAWATDQASDKGQAVAMVQEAILQHGRRFPKRCRPTPGTTRLKSGGETLPGSGSGPLHCSGEDPPRHETGTGAPRPDTQGACRPGTG